MFIIGSGIPEGFSSYVLVLLEFKWHVICPNTASTFEMNHPFSPLQSVYIVVDEENVRHSPFAIAFFSIVKQVFISWIKKVSSS